MASGFTMLVSAFLLFQVQLIAGKFLLPWFGGTPAVWATCLVFFQILLLCGYAYAHLLTSRLPRRAQAGLHVGVVAVAVGTLVGQTVAWSQPLLPTVAARPAGAEHPQAAVLWVLLLATGIPFFVLATSSPLLQHWWSRARPGPGVYRLYALSNVGSMAGLLSYPLWVEPALELRRQAWVWAAGFGLFALTTCWCAAAVLRQNRAGRLDPLVPAAEAEPAAESASVRPGVVGLWLALSATTSALLLAVTNELCQEIGTVPLLWVLPLALYLLSFVVCFDRPAWCRRRVLVPANAIATVAVCVVVFLRLLLPIRWQVGAIALFLALFCLTAHGELVRLKPSPRWLTRFYLTMALGSAMGAVLVGVVAPVVFSNFWELHLILLAGWLTLAWAFFQDKTSFFFTGDPWHPGLMLLGLNVVLAVLLAIASGGRVEATLHSGRIALALLGAGILALGPWLLVRRRRFVRSTIWPRLLVGTVVLVTGGFLVNRLRVADRHTLAVERNFYGVLRVQTALASDHTHRFRQLTHGLINHGLQYVDERLRRQPAGYCTRGSGVGLALQHHPRRGTETIAAQPLRIGVTGLGVGALAAHGRAGDQIRFYEINPAVVRIAAGTNAAFSYVADSPGRVAIVPGDARVSLEREWRNGQAQQFDVLVLDAFASDAVPVHLLTQEAFQLYLHHLRDRDGIIAVNISNRFLDFRPLLLGVAEQMGLQAVLIEHRGEPPVPLASLWVLLTRNPGFAADPEVASRSTRWGSPQRRFWTDQHSDLLGLLR